ncbi:MAG: hypothetical protein M0Q44_22375 [Methylobacter sp.]|jgi:hypothetical protein|nr:hypothetical protein [Methylobacter sp.]
MNKLFDISKTFFCTYLKYFRFIFINKGIKVLIFPKFLGSITLSWLPCHVKDIISIISKEEWLAHNFNLKDINLLYDPHVYLSAKEIYNRKYTLVLDTNIYDFLLKSVKHNSPKELPRKAIALLTFCQLSEIEIEPLFSVLERLKEDNLDDVLSDLYLFNKLNNSDTIALANYALGKSEYIELNSEIDFPFEQIKEGLTQYRKRDEWKSLYLMILKIADIHSNASIAPRNKLSTYLDWLIRDFRMGVPCIVYALVLFGKKPLSKMMKYRSNDSRCAKLKSINNMVWDLFIIRYFFIKWQEKNEHEEFIFASADKPLCEVLSLAIQVYKKNSPEPCRSYVNESDFKEIEKLFDAANNNLERIYQNPDWTPEDRYNYREQLILEHENRLDILPSE